MKVKDQRLQELRSKVPEITPTEAHALVDHGAVLIDVRETEEMAQGMAENAQALGRGFLELRIEDVVPDTTSTILTLCGSGVRSLFAADTLQQMGYRDVRSV